MTVYRLFNRLLLGLCFFSLICFVLYVFINNKANHTGFNIIFISVIIVLIFMCASFYLRKKIKNKKDLKINTIHFAILIVFLCLIAFCDVFNVMISYSNWIKRGQPNKFQASFAEVIFQNNE